MYIVCLIPNFAWNMEVKPCEVKRVNYSKKLYFQHSFAIPRAHLYNYPAACASNSTKHLYYMYPFLTPLVSVTVKIPWNKNKHHLAQIRDCGFLGMEYAMFILKHVHIRLGIQLDIRNAWSCPLQSCHLSLLPARYCIYAGTVINEMWPG